MITSHHSAACGPSPARLPYWVKAGVALFLLCLGLLSLVLLRWALRSPQTFESAFARLF